MEGAVSRNLRELVLHCFPTWFGQSGASGSQTELDDESDTQSPIVCNGELFFTAFIRASGRELWASVYEPAPLSVSHAIQFVVGQPSRGAVSVRMCGSDLGLSAYSVTR